MGRWKDGHKYIQKIIIETKDGSPALIYNLDSRGRLIYEYPVCVGIPAHVNMENTGNLDFKPPPVKVYKKSIKKFDPSIVGENTISINFPTNFSSFDQKNISNNINLCEISNRNFPKKEETNNNLSMPKNTFIQSSQQKSLRDSSLFDLMDEFILASLKEDDHYFTSFFENSNLEKQPPNESSENKYIDLDLDFDYLNFEPFFPNLKTKKK